MEFGDGSSNVTTLNGTHTFTTPGTYTVRFSVQDDDNGMDVLLFTVTVSKMKVPPIKDPPPKDPPTWVLGAIAGVGIIVVLTVVFLLLRKKKVQPDPQDKKDRKSKNL